MPSNQTPLGALPARFRRERVLIVGCGDVGQRVARSLVRRARVLALTSSAARCDALRALGVVPLVGNLDDPASLRRLAGLATRVLHLAPPPGEGVHDPRTRALLAASRFPWTGPTTMVMAGPQAMTYRNFLREVARAAGLGPRLVLPVPAPASTLSSAVIFDSDSVAAASTSGR